MPRDLFGRRTADETPLTASPDAKTPGFGSFAEQMQLSRGNTAKDDLHPYVSTLGLADLESCVALENATFPEHERCSEEKFVYRLTKCPELCLGLFSTSDAHGPASAEPTFSPARPPDSFNPGKRGVLIGHVIATQSSETQVTDESMEFPPDWQSNTSTVETRGHRDGGRTIAVHSVAILPAYQNRGLGKTIVRSHTQRMETSGIGDRIALLAHDPLVGFYEKAGFENKGKSDAKFGGGGWNDMIYEFSEHGPGMQLATY